MSDVKHVGEVETQVMEGAVTTVLYVGELADSEGDLGGGGGTVFADTDDTVLTDTDDTVLTDTE